MIRPAAAGDLPAICAIYEAIFSGEERGVSYTNWKRGQYPTPATAEDALQAGTLYVGETDGTVWGSAILNRLQLPVYQEMPWTLPAAPDRVHVIHTLCIHPGFLRRGLAQAMIAGLEDLARQAGSTVMRLDTWEGNLPANTLYPRLGYRFVGSGACLFQDCIQARLNCYEKKL